MGYFNGFPNNFQPQPMNPVVLSQQNRLAQMEQAAQPMFQSYPNNPQAFIPPQPQGLAGRFVDDVSTVTANEVALDGSPSVFVKKDLSEVYLKRWNQNGLIDTVVYKIQAEDPLIQLNKEETTPSIEDTLNKLFEPFQQRLSSIEDKLNKALAVKKPSTKKEVDTE